MWDINKYWAYFFGFFWGDGCFKSGQSYGTPNIRIVREDAEEVFPVISQILSFEYKDVVLKGRRIQGGAFFKHNKNLCKLLVENDFIFKSEVSPTKILGIIPETVKRYFWMGYIDADGCFTKNHSNRGGKFSISGAFNQDWTELESLLKTLGIEKFYVSRKQSEKGNSSAIEVSYGPNIKKLGNYLYPNGYEFGLKRKYQKYLSIADSLKKISSEWKGVSFHQGEGKWRAKVGTKHLGWFKSEDEARQARAKFLSDISDGKIHP